LYGSENIGAGMKRIIALIDFAPATSAVLDVARDLARALQSELFLVHVCVPPSELEQDEAPEVPEAPELQVAAGDRRRRDMEVLKLALRKEGINVQSAVNCEPRPGASPVAKILEEISRLRPELVVIGSHARGRLHHFLAAGTTDMVVRNAICPIVLVPARTAEKLVILPAENNL
jgi:nucleotide-binding universal stress UspA family protein